MFRLGLVDTLVTHANKEGFGLTPLSGDRRGYMPPLLKKTPKPKRRSILSLQLTNKGLMVAILQAKCNCHI